MADSFEMPPFEKVGPQPETRIEQWPEGTSPQLINNMIATYDGGQGKFAASAEAVNVACNYYESGRGDAFLTGDGTGTGKTGQMAYTACGVLDKLPAGERGLIVVPDALAPQVKGETQFLMTGIGEPLPSADRVDVMGYKEMKQMMASEEGRAQLSQYAVATFDEAHYISADPEMAQGVKETFKESKRFYATGNAMETPAGAIFFGSELKGVSQEQMRAKLGIQRGADGSLALDADSIQNISNLRNEAIRDGAMVRRERPHAGNITTEPVEVSRDQMKLDRKLAAQLDTLDPSKDKALIAQVSEQWREQSAALPEQKKLESAEKLIEQQLQQGAKPIVYGDDAFLKKLGDRIAGNETIAQAGFSLVDSGQDQQTATANLQKFTGAIDGDQKRPATVGVVLVSDKVSEGINNLNPGKMAQKLGDDSERVLISTSHTSAKNLGQQLGRVSRADNTKPANAIVLMSDAPGEIAAAKGVAEGFAVSQKTNGGPIADKMAQILPQAIQKSQERAQQVEQNRARTFPKSFAQGMSQSQQRQKSATR